MTRRAVGGGGDGGGGGGGGGAGVNFSMKNKLNSEIFSNKKAGKQKFFFSVRTKNSNWEI